MAIIAVQMKVVVGVTVMVMIMTMVVVVMHAEIVFRIFPRAGAGGENFVRAAGRRVAL